ncbi:MAG: twin-arginine translocase subunit TatC [Bellilinea sp.]
MLKRLRYRRLPKPPKQAKLAKPQADKTANMDLMQHIAELRKRLLIALAAVILMTVAALYFGEGLIDILAKPIGGVDKLVSIEVTENIGVFMRVSLLAGFIASLPITLYQLIAFLMPGLMPNERRGLVIAIPFATLLFVAGVAFAYYVMLPTALPFLISFIGVKTTPRLSNYFKFVTNLMFWIGLSFETPLVVYVLARLKIVTARQLAKQWRVAVVVIAVIAAVATPTPDPINMGLLMLPLFLLYWLSVLLAVIAGRGRKEEPGTA